MIVSSWKIIRSRHFYMKSACAVLLHHVVAKLYTIDVMRYYDNGREWLQLLSSSSAGDWAIDPLHVTSHFDHFRIRLFGRRHVGRQKCIAVIERNILLFTNASDYSHKTCMERPMCLYLTNYGSFAEVVTCVGEHRYVQLLSLNHRNTFLTPNMAAAKRTYMEVSKYMWCHHAMGL